MPPLDKDVINLAKAIRQVESGNRPVTPKEGEGFGGASRYQYSHDTWKEVARKYLGSENAPLTLENENKATYFRIKEWKDSGKTPPQIASMWNAGENEPNAYTGFYSNGKPSVGVNDYGVAYDVPGHTQKVRQAYEQIKMGGQAAPIGNTQFQTSVPQQTAQSAGVLSALGTAKPQEPQPESRLETRLAQGGEALGKLSTGVSEGDLSQVASGVLQTGGALAGGALDLVERGVNAATLGAYDASMDFIGKKIIAPVFGAVGGEKVMEQWQQFATEHPEAAKNIGAMGNIISVVPVFKVLKTGITAGKDALMSGVARTGFIKTAEEAAKAELRQSAAQAPSRAKDLLSTRILKGKSVDPVDTIVDKDYLPDVVEDANGIPRYQANNAIRKLDSDIDTDEALLQQALENASSKGLVGYVPISALRTQTDELIKKAFANRGQVDSALSKANKIFNDFEKYKGDLVPLTELNNMKRGIREAVNFNSPKLSSDVRYQMGQLFMETIEDVAEKQGIKEIGDINRTIAEKIRAKEALEFLNERSVVEKPGFRTMLGRKSGDVGTIAGEAAGQTLGIPGVGAVIGRGISNRAISGSGKSVVGKLKSKRTRKSPSKLQTGAALLGLQQASNPEDQPEQK